MPRWPSVPLSLLILFAGLVLGGWRAPTVRAQQPCGDTYTVVRGDTLFSIAQRCGTTVQEILEENPGIVDPDSIPVGLQLDLPAPPEQPEGATTYVVEPNDTLFSIAQRFNTTVARLVEANPAITNPDVIRVGQRLIIPDETGQPRVRIRPTAGPPGTTVQATAQGFPPNAQVEIGVGPARSEFEVVGTATTDAEGTLRTQVTIPEFADPGDRYVVVVTTPGRQGPEATSNIFAVTEPDAGPPVFETVEVPLIALGEGDLGCGDRLVFVERSVEPTQAPLTAALRELLAIDEPMLGQSGLYNALARSNLRLEEVTIEERTATIRLSGELRLAGVCDNPRVAAQLRQVALQYGTVDEVRVLVNGQPLDQVLSGR